MHDGDIKAGSGMENPHHFFFSTGKYPLLSNRETRHFTFATECLVILCF
jgi:hypothetical protein